MKAVELGLAVLFVSAAFAGCKRNQPNRLPGPQAEAATAAPAVAKEIAWFKGGLDAAFVKASAEGKPVFLYWGADWCPLCKDLQASVFKRPDFVDKSQLFVPVYLDGDDEGAQKAGEEFKISGYPAVVVLRADRTELARLNGGMDRNQYAEVLDLVLSDTEPANELLASAASSDAAISADDCRRLAVNAWELDDLSAQDLSRLAADLQKAVERCPADASAERARLTAIATAAASAQPETAQFKRLLDVMQGILADRALAASIADALQYFDQDFFFAVRKTRPAPSAEFVRNWNEAMDAIAVDGRYTPARHLSALRGKLFAAKALDPGGRIPPSLAAEVKQRVDAALAKQYDEYTRAGVVNSAVNVFKALGEPQRAYQVAEAEMKVSRTPYYYMGDLGLFSEELGRNEEAIAWFERAYRESKGTATRFQWGVDYLNALLRLAPQDEARIRKVAAEVLGELDGPDRLYRRSRTRLEGLEANLRKWNTDGTHASTVAAIRKRMVDICVKIPEADSARATCGKFLAAA